MPLVIRRRGMIGIGSGREEKIVKPGSAFSNRLVLLLVSYQEACFFLTLETGTIAIRMMVVTGMNKMAGSG